MPQVGLRGFKVNVCHSVGFVASITSHVIMSCLLIEATGSVAFVASAFSAAVGKVEGARLFGLSAALALCAFEFVRQ